MKSQEIRSKFLEFFESKKHSIVPSAPMVLKNDPTLMFVNSGMAPFKEYFLGNSEPKNRRITDTQKCLRVSMILSLTAPTCTCQNGSTA
jgi:alanyl-tRNA synthetase